MLTILLLSWILVGALGTFVGNVIFDSDHDLSGYLLGACFGFLMPFILLFCIFEES